MTGHDMTAEEFLNMVDKTRAQLAEENEGLRRRIAELESGAPEVSRRQVPILPSFGLSEGTRLDILEAQNRIQVDGKLQAMELVEPFTGKIIRVTAEGHELISDPDEDGDEGDTPEAPDQP